MGQRIKSSVFMYSAKTSARQPFMAADTSVVTAAFRSLGVNSGALRRSFAVGASFFVLLFIGAS